MDNPYILPVTFKVKIMLKLAILCTIFNMANLNSNKMIINKKTKPFVATPFNKTCLIEQL